MVVIGPRHPAESPEKVLQASLKTLASQEVKLTRDRTPCNQNLEESCS